MKLRKPFRQFLLTLAAAGMSACLSAGSVPALEAPTISEEFIPAESETCKASTMEHPEEAKTSAVSEEMNSEDIFFEAQSQEFISQEIQDEILSQETVPEEIPSQETVPEEILSLETAPEEIPSPETVPEEIPSQDFSSEESLSTETVSENETDAEEAGDYLLDSWAGSEQITDLKGMSSPEGFVLSWSAVPEAEGYLIGAIQNGNAFRQIDYITGGNSTGYVDKNAGLTTYSYYWVFPYKKVDGKVVRGAASSAYVYGIRQLPAPQSLTSASGSEGIALGWEGVPDADGYVVKRRIGSSGTLENIAVVSDPAYTDLSASEEEFNFYWVYAYKECESGRRPGAVSSYIYAKYEKPGIDSLFGEAAELSGFCRVKGFLEGLPQNDGITNISLTDSRAVVSFVKDGRLFAYEYQLSDRTTRVIDFNIPFDPDILIWYDNMGIFPAGNGGFFYQFEQVLRSYDRNGTLIREFALRSDSPAVYESAAAECAGSTLYLYFPDGTERSYNLPAGYSMNPFGIYGNTIMLHVFDEHKSPRYVDVDLSSGAIRVSSIPASSSKVTPCLYGRKQSDTEFFAANFRQDTFGSIYNLVSDVSPVIPYGDGFLASGIRHVSRDGRTACDATLALYSGRQKTPVFTKELSGKFGLNFSKAVIIGDCMIFFPYLEIRDPELLIMRIGTPQGAAGEAPRREELNPGTGVERIGNADYYTKKVYPGVTEVNTDYCSLGIGFYMGEDIISGPEYKTHPGTAVCTDEENLTAARQAILDYFATLPQGFLDEVVAFYEGFDIYLAGPLFRMGTWGAASETDSRLSIIFDSYYISDYVIRHEFFHAFEYALNRAAGKDVFAGWNNLNPPGFVYFESNPGAYGDVFDRSDSDPDYNAYTIFSSQASNPENIWFYSTYAKTNAQEDRAVLAEICGPTWPTESAFNSTHIQAKLREMSLQMRTYFPSLKNAGRLPWELPLWEIPQV